ncbi:hypothetical protein, partial [Dysosmobacter sp.]|uniref:hypothetical protein n=1 Tax=Dysosmobacter sp. TaxID=2591382 RepID=UPI003AB5B214
VFSFPIYYNTKWLYPEPQAAGFPHWASTGSMLFYSACSGQKSKESFYEQEVLLPVHGRQRQHA